MQTITSNATTTATINSNVVSSNVVSSGTALNNYYSTTTSPNYQWVYNETSIDFSNYNAIEEYYLKERKKGEEQKMTENNFSFGPYATDQIRLSMYGLAVKNKANKWVSYDVLTHRIMDVEVFNINIKSEKIFFKLPKAVDKVIPGDILLHNGRPVFVETVREDGKFEVIDPYEGTAVIIIPTVSPFGFNFVTQIISITDYMPEATADNPFGKLLPFVLGEDNNGFALAMMMNKNSDIDPMMLAMMSSGKSDMTTLLLLNMLNKKES